jgi:hypothetical protein
VGLQRHDGELDCRATEGRGHLAVDVSCYPSTGSRLKLRDVGGARPQSALQSCESAALEDTAKLRLDLDDEARGPRYFLESVLPPSPHDLCPCSSLEGENPRDNITLCTALLLQATPDKSTETMRLEFCQVTLRELHASSQDGLTVADEISTSNALKGENGGLVLFQQPIST